jgi:hypothetical protein
LISGVTAGKTATSTTATTATTAAASSSATLSGEVITTASGAASRASSALSLSTRLPLVTAAAAASVVMVVLLVLVIVVLLLGLLPGWQSDARGRDDRPLNRYEGHRPERDVDAMRFKSRSDLDCHRLSDVRRTGIKRWRIRPDRRRRGFACGTGRSPLWRTAAAAATTTAATASLPASLSAGTTATAADGLRNCCLGGEHSLRRGRRRRKVIITRIEGGKSECANIIDLGVLRGDQHALARAVVGDIQLYLAASQWNAVLVNGRTFDKSARQ